MREVSETYKALRQAVGSWYEVRVVLDEAIYDSYDIMHMVVHQSCLSDEDGPAIGGTVSSWCDITLDESSENWPRMAEFEIQARLVSADGETMSEWLSFGTFYTDTREEDAGYLRITAYDAMLILQQSWTDKIPPEDLPENWPITAAAAAALLEEATGISLDPGDTLDNTVAFVGLNTMSTAREVWRDIAAAQGCNAVITPAGYVHLIPLTNTEATGSAIAGIAVAGIAVVGNSSSGGSAEDYIYLGHATQKLKTSPELPAVKQVELTNEAGGTASAGTDTGYVLKGYCNFSDSAAAQLCLTHVQNYVYRPFTASGADLDPVAEPGDLVLIDGTTYQIMRIDWDLGSWIYADLDAPVEYEIDHEYKIESEAAKYYKKSVEHTDEALEDYYTKTETQSYIQENAETVVLGVTENYYYDKTDIDLQNRQLSGDITVEHDRISAALTEINTVDGEVDEIQSYIRYEMIEGVGTVVIGQTDSMSEFRISNEQIAAVYNNEIVSYWNQSKQYTPKQLQIPLGGSLRLGNILFQPRTSGNLSIFLTNS